MHGKIYSPSLPEGFFNFKALTIKHHTLGKAEKLKSRKLIELLFAEGKGFTAFPVKVVFRIVESGQRTAVSKVAEGTMEAGSIEMNAGDMGNPVSNVAKHPAVNRQPSPVQVGVSVSTRNFKKAADRNRIKRLLREAYRQQKHELIEVVGASGLQVSVFFIYLDKTLPTYDLLFDKMRYCLKRLRKTMEERP